MRETFADGARRETLEEARAKVDIIAPYVLFNLTFVDQIYITFRLYFHDRSPDHFPFHMADILPD